MATKFKIKTGDEVIVTTGKDKGKKGKVLKVFPAESRAVVQGVNVATKHQKPTQQDPGGLKKKELSIHISNIALVDPKSGKATKTGFKVEGDKKTRIARKSGEAI